MSRRKSRAVPHGGKEVRGRPSANLEAAPASSAEAGVAHRSQAPALAGWLLPLLLIGAGVAAYYNSFAGAFLLDDELRIVNNPQIRRLWPPWEAMAQSSRPILQVSLALNYAVGGVNLWGYHAFNLGVHILAGLVLFGIVRRMLESDDLRARYGGTSRWLALAVAGIWLAHPLQTASVTYIIQRAESLMGLFFLLTLYCGIRACQSPQPRRWGIAAVLACALGMGSKEVMVSAPILMWIYDWVFISRTASETFRRRWGLYASLAATWLVLLVSMATSRPEEVVGLNPSPGAPWSYAITQFGVIVHYLRLSIWPAPLVFDYAWPLADSVAEVLPWAVVVLALLGGTVLALRKRVWVGFWGAWFFLVLAPTSSILPIADVAFEHRMYLPLAAVVAVVVIGGHDLFRFLGRRVRMSADLRGWLEAGLVITVVTILGYATILRNDDYRSEFAMWTDTLAKRPDNARAHSNLGAALTREGKSGEAMFHYTEAIRLLPDSPEAHTNLGVVLYREGRKEEGLVHLFEAVRLRPGFANGQNNLAVALRSEGRNEEAAAHFSRGTSLKPDPSQAHNDLGNALYRQGRIKEAIAEYSEAVRLTPGFAEAHHNLGLALLDSGDVPGAIARFSEAVRVKPDYAKAHNNLGTLLYQQRRVKEAIAHFSEAVRLDPTFAEARSNLQAAQAAR